MHSACSTYQTEKKACYGNNDARPRCRTSCKILFVFRVWVTHAHTNLMKNYLVLNGVFTRGKLTLSTWAGRYNIFH